MTRRSRDLPAMPDPHQLMAADLVVVGTPHDDRDHLVDGVVHAETLAATAEQRRATVPFVALCGRHLRFDSLLAPARRDCPDCLIEAIPRLRRTDPPPDPAAPRGRRRLTRRDGGRRAALPAGGGRR